MMDIRTINDFRRYLRKLKSRTHHPEDYIFGIELEGALTDSEGRPLKVRKIIPKLNEMFENFEFDKEAGASQLEIRSFPRSFSICALREIEEYLLDVVNSIVEVAERVHKKDAIFLLIGSNPHPDTYSDRWITNSERARAMAKWRSRFSSIPIGSRRIEARHIPLGIQSLHLHIQGKSPEDVADKYNRLLYTIPEYIAFSANSPIVAGEPLDYTESRLLLYEQADGGYSGFPKIKKYPISINEYVEYIFSYPTIMEGESLFTRIKERHEDVRIRFEFPFRVETRVYPIQCTIRENMALIEYTVGRLKYAQTLSRQDFPSLKEIEINRIEAIRKSLKGEFVWNGKSIDVKEYLLEGIKKAEKGLKLLGFKPKHLNIIKRRVEKRKTSGDVIKRWFEKRDGDVNEKVAYLVNRIWKHTKDNKPIV
ncbi:MAG: hypothetical protein J7L45_00500 [Candidatus Aenigmarchaeota archaeon]|nr:hypothetical protein [Candidatus Aenigmarchaeota archaeon]